MDPLTITASVLRITGSCFGAAKTLWEIRTKWKLAPVTVSTLSTQLKLTAASLSQIRWLLLKHEDVLGDRPDLRNTFDTTLTNCLVVTTWLDKVMQKITKGVLDGNTTEWKTRFRTLWKEHEAQDLSKQLDTQQGALIVLVGLLQMDKISDIWRVVRRHEALLDRIAANTQHLRQTRAVDAPASILSKTEENDSILNHLVDTKEDDTSFEAVILGTRVYSNAFTGTLDVTDDDQSDDTRTIVNTSMLDNPTPILASTSERRKWRLNGKLRALFKTDDDQSDDTRTVVDAIVSKTPTPEPETVKLALQYPQIKSSIERLGIIRMYAKAGYDFTATSVGELSFKCSQTIEDMEMIERTRYKGLLRSDSQDIADVRGHFYRARVRFSFDLHQPLTSCATGVFHDPPNDGFLTLSKGAVLDITCISHDVYCWAKMESVYGFAFVSDVDIESALERDVDQLLKFFSCPMPALASLSKRSQRAKIQEMVERGDEKDIVFLQAHCSSWKELQFLSSLRKEWLVEQLKNGRRRKNKQSEEGIID